MSEVMVKYALPLALIFVMTGVGISLRPADFLRVAKCPKAFFLGAFCQLVLLPLLAIAVITAFGLKGELALGVLVISLCPGGVTSNLFTYLSRADVGLSVSLTAIIGLITPVTLPLIVNWGLAWQGVSGEQFQLPFAKTMLELMAVCVFPVFVGMSIRKFVKEKAALIENIVRKVSTAVLAIVILGMYLKLGVEKVNAFALLAGPACLTMNLLGMTLGLGLAYVARLKRAQRTCIMLEVGLQNGTVALLVTTGILKSLEMSIAPSIYSLWMMVPATAVVWWSKRRRSLDPNALAEAA